MSSARLDFSYGSFGLGSEIPAEETETAAETHWVRRKTNKR
jgi:hypothetical protein